MDSTSSSAADDSGDLLRLLVDSTVDYAIFTLDVAGNVSSWNKGAERVKGYAAHEIIGRHFSVFYRPQEVAKGHPEKELRLAADRGQYTEEGWRVREDGSLMWANVTLVALHDEGGRLRGFGKVTRDATARKAAEDALAESEERFRQLADSMSDAYVLADLRVHGTAKRWDIAYAGGAFEEIFGIPPQDYVRTGNGLREQVHPDDAERVLGLWGKDEPLGNRELEFRVRRFDGSERWIRARYRWLPKPPRDDSERPPRLAVTFEDITQRKAFEAQLELARAAAEKANRAKSEFLSRMSHELRTPLNAVLGFAQLLEMRALPIDIVEDVRHIRSAGDHLLALINELLDISLIETGSLSMSVEDVALPELLSDVVDLLRPLSERARVSVSLHLEDGLLPALADRQRVRQILINLLSNAIKYNRVGGTIFVRAATTTGPVPHIQVEVEDTGVGIPATYLPRLFQAFDRLGAEHSNIEGTGVGLAVAQGLAKAMGGSLSADSVFGLGSTFTLDLPAGEFRGLPEAGGLSINVSVSSGGEPTGARLRVVYIEDNPANVEIMAAILRLRPDWELRHAATGAAGMELLVADPPDLVLLDLHLPDMHGEDVLREVGANRDLSGIPITIITADATKSEMGRLRGVGVFDYLTKPVDVTAVLAMLDQVAAKAVPRG